MQKVRHDGIASAASQPDLTVSIYSQAIPREVHEMRTQLISAIVVAMTVAFASSASAQVSNTPYSPGAAQPGAGISLGYRQAILNAKILGQRPRALVKGPSGELLGIRQGERNALVLNPGDGSFITGARPNASWPTGLGTGLGWSSVVYSSSGGYAAAPSQSLNTWISLVPSGPNGETSNFGRYIDGGTPIDTWIMQLNLI